MSGDRRLADYLDNIRVAATDALAFVAGMTREDFFVDRRTAMRW